jgi:hypothetical protein
MDGYDCCSNDLFFYSSCHFLSIIEMMKASVAHVPIPIPLSVSVYGNLLPLI